MDDLRKKSDKELTRIEKALTKIYKEAEKEISEKWEKYMKQAEKRLAPLEKAYEDAKRSGDEDLIKKTGFELGKAKKLETVQNNRFKAMTEETAARLTNVNQVALDYVNGNMPKIYTMNYNETLGEIETEIGKVGVSRSFSLMDENTAKNLVKSDTSLFPQKVIDKAKDKKWNLKSINSQVLQGLLQGESIPKISKRLQNVTDMNSAVATRNARTMCTAAENNGRLSGIKEAEDKGIVYEKQWMATHDDRTRESHQELDGVSVPVDEEFPNGLQYPGDPDGEPEQVWNCRCSMVRKLIGFRKKDGSISEVGEIHQYNPDYFQTAEPEQAAQAEQNEKGKEKSEPVKVEDLSEELQKTLYDYTDGKYEDICSYSQYLENGDKDISPSGFVSSKEKWERDRLPDIDAKTREQAKKIAETIKNQPTTDEKLWRIERETTPGKEGDVLTFGIKSTSASSDFVSATTSGEMEGFSNFDFLGKSNTGAWTEYRFANSKSLDISQISKYPDQNERLICGNYKIVKTETIEAQKAGWTSKEIKIADVAENVEHFTSKSGKEMVRYTYDGKNMTDTVEKFESRTERKETWSDGVWGRKIVYLEVAE